MMTGVYFTCLRCPLIPSWTLSTSESYWATVTTCQRWGPSIVTTANEFTDCMLGKISHQSMRAACRFSQVFHWQRENAQSVKCMEPRFSLKLSPNTPQATDVYVKIIHLSSFRVCFWHPVWHKAWKEALHYIHHRWQLLITFLKVRLGFNPLFVFDRQMCYFHI